MLRRKKIATAERLNLLAVRSHVTYGRCMNGNITKTKKFSLFFFFFFLKVPNTLTLIAVVPEWVSFLTAQGWYRACHPGAPCSDGRVSSQTGDELDFNGHRWCCEMDVGSGRCRGRWCLVAVSQWLSQWFLWLSGELSGQPPCSWRAALPRSASAHSRLARW